MKSGSFWLVIAVGAACLYGCHAAPSIYNTTGPGPIVEPCVDAYATAVAVHATVHRDSDFDPAIAACHTFAEWTTAVSTDSPALGADPMDFLRARCRTARSLAKAVICAPINR